MQAVPGADLSNDSSSRQPRKAQHGHVAPGGSQVPTSSPTALPARTAQLRPPPITWGFIAGTSGAQGKTFEKDFSNGKSTYQARGSASVSVGLKPTFTTKKRKSLETTRPDLSLRFSVIKELSFLKASGWTHHKLYKIKGLFSRAKKPTKPREQTKKPNPAPKQVQPRSSAERRDEIKGCVIAL